jgi:hypothetical protein
MNPLQDPQPPDASTPAVARISTSIRLLRWIEIIGLESDYSKLRKQEPLDAWMFIEDGQPMGPVPLREILLKLREGQSPIDIIHESKAYDTEPQWSELVYNPVWNRPGAALAWTIGFWIIVVSIGFITMRIVLPFGILRTLGTIAYVLGALGLAYARTKPHLKAWAARTRGPDESTEG